MPAHRNLLRLIAALFAFALLGAACGGDDDDSGDDPTIQDDGGDGTSDEAASDDGGDDEGGGGGEVPNPCELITLAEMETAFGFAWNEGEYAPPDIAPNATCTWSDADPAAPAKVVTLSVLTDAAAEEVFAGQTVKDIHDATRAALSESEILEADLGLGDDSYRTASGIYILDGDTTYSIVTIGGVSDDAVAGFKAMAATVVGG